MPELPEVETVVRELRPHLEGRVILDAQVDWPRTIAEPAEDVERFREGIRGRRIAGLERRGKFVLIGLDGEGSSRFECSLLVHLRMSGRLLLEPLGKEEHLRAVFALSDPGRQGESARLYFYDARKFGRIWLVRDPSTVVGDLGPEPLAEAFGLDALASLLRRRHGMLKPLLLNQQFLAGLGNIYTDEALFLAGLHPQRKADTLNEEEIRRLYHAIQAVLRRAIEHHGTTFDGVFVRPQGEGGRQQEGLYVYGRAGLPCVRCGTPIQRILVGARGTHFCPHCQPLPEAPTNHQRES